MSVLLVIPARYASTRYPGKPLVELAGASGVRKSLIQRTWEAARQVQCADRIVIATDDVRIKDIAEGFGAEVIMTSTECRNGTERCAEVAEVLSGYDLVVNFQGDALLTPPWFVDDIISALKATNALVTTPVLRCDAAALDGFKEDRKNDRVGGTTAVFDSTGKAFYFSKEVLPYTGRKFDNGETVPVFHHVGVYAFRAEVLCKYAQWPEGNLEHWEGLEQLRFMENNIPVHCVRVDAKGHSFWELNNPVDVERIERVLVDQGIA